MSFRAVFVGTVEFSFFALQKLIELGQYVQIQGVITKKQSTFHSDFQDLTPLCSAHGIPVRYVSNINDEQHIQWIRELRPDVLFVFGWSQLIRRPLLDIPSIGAIGFHPAQLPQNRGRHPIIWALVLGLEQTASTFFFLDEGTDSGDILSQRDVPITYEDTARTLYDRIVQIALQQIEEFVPQLAQGTYQRIPQDHSRANYWRKRSKQDGKIDFRMSSRSIYNLVRALTRPYPGAHIDYQDREVKVWKVREEKVYLPNIEPGKILALDQDRVLVKCGDQAVWIEEHEFEHLPEVGTYILP